ncbi:MAG: CDP-glycerol glycerophosphotransferase family protein [Lachnospiraceae bacterium]|nr:CDP-glycerol glycerophosphotransferase family protein [Lachnospiraceae bacterium]
MKISAPQALRDYDPEKIVVLITGLRSFEEIAEQLRGRGVLNYYSVLCMEARHRLELGIKDTPDRRREFFEKCRNMPLMENRIVLITTNDGAGHGKNIVKALMKRNEPVDVVWFVQDAAAPVPKGARAVPYRDYRSYYQNLMTAKIWLADTGVPTSLKKEGQIYIQMKHWASVTLKMFGYDEMNYRGEEDTGKFGMHGLDFMEYVLVGSEFDERTCRSGFRFDGEAVYVGSPRSDTLFHTENDFKELRSSYELSAEEHYLLFAPTYRIVEKGSVETKYSNDLDFDKIWNALQDRFGGEWRILLRFHPFVAALSKDISYPEYVTDVSDYYDSEELVAVSDIMITDYSSIMFEPAFVGKPVFLLATDRKEYLSNERGFLIDYNTLPFPVAETNEQLACNILNFNIQKYERDVKAFLDKYGVHEDGHASERAADFLVGLLG